MRSSRWSDRRRPSKVVRHRRTRLYLELLEDRTVPSLAVGQSYDGIADSESSCGCYPPDTNAAVGNNFVVETVNIQIRMFNKTTGAVLLDEPLGTLFGAATGGDPYVVYDDIADRWYVTAFDGSDSGLFLAVSDDGNPVDGSWTTYHLTEVGGFPDYQKLGFNKDAIFISYNDFGVGDPGPAAIASIDKTAALTGTLSYFVSHPDFQFRAMPPAQMHGDTLGGVEWFVSTDGTDAGGNTMRVTNLTNYLSNSPVFTYTSLPVTQYQSAVQADQPGGSVTVFPNTTTYQVQYRNGHLVTAMASGTAADGFVYPKGLYYQIDVSSGTPTLLQEGVIDPGAGVAVQMPSVDEVSGNLGFTWIESSSSEFLSMWVGALDTSGNFDSVVVAPGGGFFDYSGRLGDYSTTVLDPDGNTFWSANEYIGSDGASNVWRTHIASFTLGLGVVSSTPARGSIVTTKPINYVINFSDPVNPGSVQPSDFTVTSDGISHAATGVTLNGTNTQATFSFDPDANPVTVEGPQNMAIAAGAITRASDGGGILPFNATFRYDQLRMEIVSTVPPGPVAAVPLTTFKLNLNEAVAPGSVSESDLALSQGTVLGYSLENSDTTISFTLDGITAEGTLDVGIAAGAFTDSFGNPNLPFAGTYTLVTGMAVYSSTPAEGDIVSTAPTDFVINFTLPYDPSTVDLNGSDLTVNGIAATSRTLTDADTVTFHFGVTPVTAQGVQTMHMDAGVVDAESSSGLPDPANIAWTGTFRWDALTLAVSSTNHDPSGSLISLTGPVAYDVTFNEPVAESSVDPTDLTLSQGTVTSAQRDPVNFALVHYVIGGLTTEGTLNVDIAEGALTDIYGNPGFAGFSASYVLDFDTVAFPTPLTEKLPLGSLIYDATASGIISPGDIGDSFTINVAAGQTITVLVTPSSSLLPTITLTPPGAPTGFASASGVGKKALLQTLAAGGTQTITVRGAGETTGGYTVQVVLNAALETESNDGAANNTPGTAQNIDGSFIPLLKGATRGAVLGQTDAVNSTVTLLSANFETTTGDNAWTIANGSTGLWHRSNGHGPESGHTQTNSMYFGKGEKYGKRGAFTKGNYEVKSKGKVVAVSGAIISPNIVLPPGGQITVDFNYILETEGAPDLAQLQIKPTSGTTWTTLTSYNGVAESSVWRAANTVDVSSFSGQTVQLRFYFQSNTVANNFEGWYVDDVVVRQTVPHDNYSFSIGAAQKVTVVLESLGAGDINVVLRNAGGTATLATGTAGPTNVDKAIYNFDPLAAGTYNLAITGDANTPYRLITTLGAVFDAEGNDSYAAAQDMTGTQGGLGHVTAGTDLFGLHGSPVVGGLVLAGSKITLGINPDGSFITGGTGIQFLGNEFVVPGTPVAGFTIGQNGGNYTNKGALATTDISVTLEDLSSGTLRGVRIVGTVGGTLQLERVIAFRQDDEFVTIATRLTNFSGTAISNVAWLENLDPDQGEPLGVSYDTFNDVVLGGQFVRADAKPSGFPGGLTIGMGSSDARRVVSAEGFDNRDPFEIINSPVDPDGAAADIGINLAFNFGNLGAGQAAAGVMIMTFGRTTAEAEATYSSHTAGTLVADEDWYKLTVGGDGKLDLVTSTPGDGSGEPGNTLDPHIEVYLTSSTVPVYTGTEFDGRNEEVHVTGLTPGTVYRVRITAEAGTSGEYFLDPPLEAPATLSPAPSVRQAPSSGVTRLGIEALAFAQRPSAVFAGATLLAVDGNGTVTRAPVVLSTVTVTAAPASIQERVGDRRESLPDAAPSNLRQESAPAIPPAELDVPPTAPSDEEQCDSSAACQLSGCVAFFADPSWQSTLPALMVAAPSTCADVAEPAADLAAAVVAFAFLLDSRRASATTKKRTPVAATER